jgi:hypothetical protein
MKSVLLWGFWIIVAIAGWRWIGPSVRDFEDRTACTYQNAAGDCLTQAQYIKMVAHDAAADAISDLMNECSSPSASGDVRCAVFNRN